MIYKYPLKLTDVQHVTMPKGARILSVHDQRGTICLWALVDASEVSTEARLIEIIGTGNPMPVAKRQFIGTVVQEPFVWHVFER